MFDHVALSTGDFDASKAFYKAALAPLGLRVVLENEAMVGIGDGERDLWLEPGEAIRGKLHIGFRAADRAAVDAFHAAALAAGGRCNGPPGLRTRYHPHYYGAYVLDPDGHNVEAVCHSPEAPVVPPGISEE